MTARRISDFGISIGKLPRGPRNALTDVPGVAVGHCTVRTQAWNTGVTVILPAQDNLFLHKVVGACQVLNGFGKTLGLMQLEELGTIETPIALTNTLNVGLVHDALVQYSIDQGHAAGVEVESVNPIVCECNDAGLSDIQHRAIGYAQVMEAISSAGADFAQGCVRGHGHGLPQPQGRHRLGLPPAGGGRQDLCAGRARADEPRHALGPAHRRRARRPRD